MRPPRPRSMVPAAAVVLLLAAAPQPAEGREAAALPAKPADRADTSCRQKPPAGQELPDSLPGRPLQERLGLTQAWDLSAGEGVTVGVVDSGVDHRHPRLSGSVDTGAELVMERSKKEYRTQKPKAPALDCEGHGTSVAGLVAGNRGGDGRVPGVAPEARVHPVRVVDGVERASANTLAAAIDRAVDSDAKVLNLSFALPVDRAPVRQAVARATKRDVLVVAAAGNEGTSGRKTYPAAYPKVLAVGAVDPDGQPLKESNRGSWVDLAAYGAGEVMPAAGGSGYVRDKGTSFAAPQVSGAAALVRSRFPDMPAAEVRQRLVESAAPVGGGSDPRTGAGIVDPFGALTDLDEGHGDDSAQPAAPGTLPVQPVPQQRPMLPPTDRTAVAWSAGLLLTAALTLLGAPALRRAASRRWRPGPPTGRRPPARGRRARTQPAAAAQQWLTGSPAHPAGPHLTPVHTAPRRPDHATRQRRANRTP